MISVCSGPRRLSLAVLVVCLVVASANQAAAGQASQPAQSSPSANRVFIDIGGGMQLGSKSFQATHTEQIFAEESTFQARYPADDAVLFGVGGGVRVWKGLFAAVSYTRLDHSERVAVSAKVPHPFFFNQPRTVEGESEPLSNQQQAIHISATYVVPAGRRFEVAVSGGPSVFDTKRAFVTDVLYTEEYPYDVATFSGVTSAKASAWGVGLHGSVDVTWLVTPKFGVGVLMRGSRASLDFTMPSGESVKVDAGGFEVAAGLRLRFGTVRNQAAAHQPQAPPEIPPPGPGDVINPERPGSGREAVLTEAAPVFLRPDATRVPLRTLAAGTTVKVLEKGQEWTRIEFNDRQFGPRVGYVLSKYVRPRS